MNGRWTVGPRQYVEEVRRFKAEVGQLQWASIQDWMCEPFITKKTGKTLAEHQRLTIENYADLLNLAPDLPWVPVLQGQRERDYLRHLDDYQRAGFDLTRVALVGLGSVCRRQATKEAAEIAARLFNLGVTLHGFGFKIQGLKKVDRVMASTDSMAWSRGAMFKPPPTRAHS